MSSPHSARPTDVRIQERLRLLEDSVHPAAAWYREDVDALVVQLHRAASIAHVERKGLEEQFEILRKAAQEVEGIAFHQYLDWMHFHELAMSEPFQAEREAQDFARCVGSLLTIALGADTTIQESSPAKRPS